MQDVDGRRLLRIFPAPAADVPLRGLYLTEPLSPPAERTARFVYANFIASLDGRISLADPEAARRTVPRAIANERDWRLFQELAAGADALLTSGSYARAHAAGLSTHSFPVSGKPEYADLLQWRAARGLAPQPAVVILSASLELPTLEPLVNAGRRVYVATGAAASDSRVTSLESQGVRVLRVGAGRRAEGRRLVEALASEAHRNVAVIGGGEIVAALIADGVLDRLYLTLACRLVGGTAFDTLLSGPTLERAAGFTLKALHYDAPDATTPGIEQLFAILDRSR